MNPRILILGAVLASPAATLPALAQGADGVIVIDQAKAIAGSVTPGDAPGFPVTINQPGSYRLTGNLSVDAQNLHAIVIGADGVTLDLNGFTIQGPVACSGLLGAMVCAHPQAAGSGVVAYQQRNVSVRNGVIRGFGFGVNGGMHSRFEKLHVAHSARYGMVVGEGSVVADSSVFMSADVGIYGASPSELRHNSVTMTGNNGIVTGQGSLVIGNRVTRAGRRGIWSYLQGPATLIDNVVTQAGGYPIVGGVNAGGNTCDGQLCP